MVEKLSKYHDERRRNGCGSVFGGICQRSMTCLGALEEKSWNSEKCKQSIVVHEEFVNNSVMDGEVVENSLMDPKIDPKVVMYVSIFKIGGWNHVHPSDEKLLEVFSLAVV